MKYIKMNFDVKLHREGLNMDNKELNRRVNQVFDLRKGEHCQEVFTYNGELHIMLIDEDKIPWDYVPDMSERPEAFDYILGKRSNFND